jgi:hypothetical protein
MILSGSLVQWKGHGLAAKLKTPLQTGQHLVRAFEAGFEVGIKPVDEGLVEAVLSSQIDDLGPRLTRNGLG